MSWRQKKMSMTKTATPKSTLYTSMYCPPVTSTSVVVSNTPQTASNIHAAA